MAVVHPLDEPNLDHWGGRRKEGEKEEEKEEISAYLVFISFSRHPAMWFHRIIPKSHNIPTTVFMGLFSCMHLSVSLCESSRSEMEWQKMEAKIGGDVLKP